MEDKEKDLREKERKAAESAKSGQDKAKEAGDRAENGKDKSKERAPAETGDDTVTAGKSRTEEPAERQPTSEKQLADLTKKNEEYCDRLLRLQADFDNYRKRVAREKEEMYGYVAGEVILDFLGVLDNMERAVQSAAVQSCDCGSASLREGIQMVVKQLKEILAKYDVEEIPAKGEKFDPNFHHAVMQAEDSGKEEGTVLEVLQKGYMIKKRVLRPSIVKVAL
ncbi:MAG: nucleotide exchange factor GrpE [Bacillota bacterium]|nr:nucleotide exchange factor GrpE [Bacillota bacterium]MDD3298155.1 nucleotide exchange factor GrpE [Bacillota bacterium]MDD3850365.1 nucleotide exchange factor GrpE [Bacillota bacterium]MDD4708073.1 nucleotide exchange factor GrpE [Bacillota bacterium]